MTENDLVDKLAELEYDQGENGLWENACREVKAIYWQHVTKDFLPIIRSYANALVAAAVSECIRIAEEVSKRNRESAKNLHTAEIEKMGRVESRNSYGLLDGGAEVTARLAKMFRAVTPESAAKELERIKNEEYHRGTDAAVCHPARCRDEMIWRKEIAEARLEALDEVMDIIDEMIPESVNGKESLPILYQKVGKLVFKTSVLEASKEK